MWLKALDSGDWRSWTQPIGSVIQCWMCGCNVMFVRFLCPCCSVRASESESGWVRVWLSGSGRSYSATRPRVARGRRRSCSRYGTGEKSAWMVRYSRMLHTIGLELHTIRPSAYSTKGQNRGWKRRGESVGPSVARACVQMLSLISTSLDM